MDWTMSHPPHEVDHSMERPGFSVDFDVPGPHPVSWTSALTPLPPPCDGPQGVLNMTNGLRLQGPVVSPCTDP